MREGIVTPSNLTLRTDRSWVLAAKSKNKQSSQSLPEWMTHVEWQTTLLIHSLHQGQGKKNKSWRLSTCQKPKRNTFKGLVFIVPKWQPRPMPRAGYPTVVWTSRGSSSTCRLPLEAKRSTFLKRWRCDWKPSDSNSLLAQGRAYLSEGRWWRKLAKTWVIFLPWCQRRWTTSPGTPERKTS